jgi:hypothetical protein
MFTGTHRLKMSIYAEYETDLRQISTKDCGLDRVHDFLIFLAVFFLS